MGGPLTTGKRQLSSYDHHCGRAGWEAAPQVGATVVHVWENQTKSMEGGAAHPLSKEVLLTLLKAWF